MFRKPLLLFVFSLIGFSLKAQTYFNLNGNIKNFKESYITFSLYQNWVEDPIDFNLKVDAKGNFALNIPLTEIAYCDINFGNKGIYSWLIEPNDKLEVSIDFKNFEKSFQVLGPGSSKWVYLKEFKNKYDENNDIEVELNKYNGVSKKGFFDVTQFYYNEQLNLLNKYKDLVSEEFYSLVKADLYGKISNRELQYLVDKKLFNQKEFERFQLKGFNAKIQNKSLYFGLFADNLINNHNQLAKKFNASKLLEYETYKAYFDKYDLVSKTLIDRILALKIISYIDLDGITEENKILVGSYVNYSKNKVYSNAVYSKLNLLQDIQPGQKAKNFILKDNKGDYVSLKDFKGKNVFISFYTSWCGPCVNDLKFLEIINNYFKSKNDFVFISISLDDPVDYAEFLKSFKVFGIKLNAYDKKDIKLNYALESVPKYYLLDKTGTIISEKLIEPSDDEGRALIKQIERLINVK